MDKHRLFEELKQNPKKVRFEKLCRTAEVFGFRLRGGKGIHRVYVHDDVLELVNFQNVGAKAKPYQMKQFIKLIEKYELLEVEDDV
ncbi:MAG: type II toxin-antitoxin system HicA family toxin [Candidatus Methanospirareceae archaeon]